MSFWSLTWQAVILHYLVNFLHQLEKPSWMISSCHPHSAKSTNSFVVLPIHCPGQECQLKLQDLKA